MLTCPAAATIFLSLNVLKERERRRFYFVLFSQPRTLLPLRICMCDALALPHLVEFSLDVTNEEGKPKSLKSHSRFLRHIRFSFFVPNYSLRIPRQRRSIFFPFSF